jgi:putative intracellular protease/amidase
VLDVTKKKRVLIILSEHGFWGEELIGPLETFDKANYEVKFATPKGKHPTALPSSMDPDYIDPALGRSVTSKIVADKVKAIDKSPRLDNPLSIFAMMPEIPYFSSQNLISDLEAYYKVREKVKTDVLAKFDALLIVGGSGALIDLANNQRVHDIILAFLSVGLPIGAESCSVACLAFARELENRKSIIWGKRVTGRCREYDNHDGTRLIGTDFNMGPPPYPIEYILRDATGPDGACIDNFGKETSVVVDHPFITGRAMQDSYLVGQKMVEVMEKGLKRFGW